MQKIPVSSIPTMNFLQVSGEFEVHLRRRSKFNGVLADRPRGRRGEILS
jgi:hypothetical protein